MRKMIATLIVRTKGAEILDAEGRLICRLAYDLTPFNHVRITDFCDWQIPVPDQHTVVHPAIVKFMRLRKSDVR